MKSRICLIGLLSAFSCLFGCKKDRNIYSDKNKLLINDLNAKSVDTLELGGHKYVLNAYLWRDFMPVSPPDGQPLLSINDLIEVDSADVAATIELTKQYVIYQDSVWISTYDNSTRVVTPSFKIERISRNGPKWGPKVHVDVIAEVHDSGSQTDYYIREKHVLIARTD